MMLDDDGENNDNDNANDDNDGDNVLAPSSFCSPCDEMHNEGMCMNI